MAQEDLRRRVVAAVVEQHRTQDEVAGLFGVSVRSVSRWVNAFRRKGNKALNARKRGQRLGVQKALDARQQATIRRVVRHRDPAQEALPGLCWTRRQVRELIRMRYGISLSKQTVAKYLRSWGLSPQQPIRKAWQQDPQAVRAWKEHTYPTIVAQARADNGMIVWLDQTGIRSDAAVGVTWADEGSTPLVEKTGVRFGVNAMCAITNRGHLYFTVYEGSFTPAIMIDFCRRLIRTLGTTIHLIVDGHPTHKSKAVTNWITDHTDDIQLHYLPGYSPELNPVEILNADLKPQVAHTNPTNKSDMATNIRAVLRRIRHTPGRVASYFMKPEVAYTTQ